MIILVDGCRNCLGKRTPRTLELRHSYLCQLKFRLVLCARIIVIIVKQRPLMAKLVILVARILLIVILMVTNRARGVISLHVLRALQHMTRNIILRMIGTLRIMSPLQLSSIICSLSTMISVLLKVQFWGLTLTGRILRKVPLVLHKGCNILLLLIFYIVHCLKAHRWYRRPWYRWELTRGRRRSLIMMFDRLQLLGVVTLRRRRKQARRHIIMSVTLRIVR